MARAAGAVLITVLIASTDVVSGGLTVDDAVSRGGGGPAAATGASAAVGAPLAAAMPVVAVPFTAAAGAASTRSAATRPSAVPVLDVRGQMALDFALAQRGKPYVYGGTGPDVYDCSGLAQRAWRAAGVRIPRTTEEQARFGTAVPLSQVKPGDLVIFYPDASHVGIYAGHGTVVVAPHAGAVVMLQLIKWMPVDTVRRPG